MTVMVSFRPFFRGRQVPMILPSAIAELRVRIAWREQADAGGCRCRPERLQVAAENPRGAAELDWGQLVGRHLNLRQRRMATAEVASSRLMALATVRI